MRSLKPFLLLFRGQLIFLLFVFLAMMKENLDCEVLFPIPVPKQVFVEFAKCSNLETEISKGRTTYHYEDSDSAKLVSKEWWYYSINDFYSDFVSMGLSQDCKGQLLDC